MMANDHKQLCECSEGLTCVASEVKDYTVKAAEDKGPGFVEVVTSRPSEDRILIMTSNPSSAYYNCK